MPSDCSKFAADDKKNTKTKKKKEKEEHLFYKFLSHFFSLVKKIVNSDHRSLQMNL